MTMTLDLPPDLEARLTAEAARRGVSPEECLLEVLDTAVPREPHPLTPAEMVQQWEREGVIGIWADRTDLPESPEYARQLRHRAEQRARNPE
jgi:hypothetical protein